MGCTVTRSDLPGTRVYSAYDAAHGGRLAEKGGGDVESAVVVDPIPLHSPLTTAKRVLTGFVENGEAGPRGVPL